VKAVGPVIGPRDFERIQMNIRILKIVTIFSLNLLLRSEANAEQFHLKCVLTERLNDVPEQSEVLISVDTLKNEVAEEPDYRSNNVIITDVEISFDSILVAAKDCELTTHFAINRFTGTMTSLEFGNPGCRNFPVRRGEGKCEKALKPKF
jgi:hypothetical protein